jgi:hypothetical protein
MVSYWIGVNRVSMMDLATHQQKRIYASFLSQIHWTKITLLQKSHEKIESIFRIEFEDEMVLQVLILCFEFWLSRSISTVATTWLGIFESGVPDQGIPDREMGVWDPRESGIPGGNESRSHLHGSLGSPELEGWNESQTRIHWRLGSQWMNPRLGSQRMNPRL